MRELPQGTVTMVFTDIEGSTRLLARLRDEYEQVLRDYRRLLRASFEGAGGREVDTQGDAFFFAFERARAAATATVEAQRALYAHDWPGGIRLRARMALHTGEPVISEEGLVGISVHRAARLCAAGHGGQVLVSRTVCDLLEEDLPEKLGLVDLGEHSLSGFDRSERIFQLIAAGLPRRFPPLRTARRGSRRARIRMEVIVGTLRARRILRLAAVEGLEATKRPHMVGALGGIGLLAALVQPWFGFGALAVAGLVARNVARGFASYHGLEDTGFRIYGTASVATDEDLSREVRALGAAAVRASRAARIADRLLQGIEGKRLERRLGELRARHGPTPLDLHQADVLAREIALFSAALARRETLEPIRAELVVLASELREKLFETRIDSSLWPGLVDEVAELRSAIDEAAVSLDHACRELAASQADDQALGRIRFADL